ncbi:alpha/beta fold hydrolase [Rhodobacteraceae bacterium RKSG542]|nr:alpha/beta fold hydrolase [Pseudovibrio flavus]
MTGETLAFVQAGLDSEEPIVFIHGFGGDASTWAGLQKELSQNRPTYAFDLPSHGGSLNWPELGNAVKSARALSQSFDVLGLKKVHLVGHSLGGAIASLIAMRTPDKVASLTLVAPGGFGEEINASALQAYAKKVSIEAQLEILKPFFGPDFAIPQALVEHYNSSRAVDGAAGALAAIAGSFLLDGKQGVLPLAKIAELPMPISLIWGTEDGILPYAQTQGLPEKIALHSIENAGHMLQIECPQEVLQVIRKTVGLA